MTHSNRRPIRIGLTGGVASGKSAAASAFERLGATVIDTDQIARDVVEPGTPGLHSLVQLFGESVLDSEGRLDRSRLRQRVFANPSERKRLEALLHPLIIESLWERADNSDAPYVILVIPLLVEGGHQEQLDRVVVVDVDDETQRERLRSRDGVDDVMIDQMLAAQCTREHRLQHADDVLDNSGSLEDLYRQVASLNAWFLQMARDA